MVKKEVFFSKLVPTLITLISKKVIEIIILLINYEVVKYQKLDIKLIDSASPIYS